MDERPEGVYAHVDQPAFEQMQIDQSISRVAIFFVCFLTLGVFYFTLVNFPLAKLLPIQQMQQVGQVVSALNPTSSRSPVATSKPSGALGGSQASTAASPAGSPAASVASAAAAGSSSAATSAPVSVAPLASASALASAGASAGATGGSYQVQAGDTLSSIARRFNTTVQALADANKIPASGSLQVGQRLVIPR